jgi:hypothetical protein
MSKPSVAILLKVAILILLWSPLLWAQTSAGLGVPDRDLSAAEPIETQNWNWHIQNTDIVQSDPGFRARYSGSNSLNNTGNTKETISLDLFTGLRLWHGRSSRGRTDVAGLWVKHDSWHRVVPRR